MSSTSQLIPGILESVNPDEVPPEIDDARLFGSGQAVGVAVEEVDELNSFATSEAPRPSGKRLIRGRNRNQYPTKEGTDMPVQECNQHTADAKLEKAVQEFEQIKGINLTDPDRKSVCEFLRLSALYPGEHVAFRDEYEGEGDSLRLLRRQVLCHSRNVAVVERFIHALPEQQQESICMSFVEPRRAIRGR